MGLLDRFKKKEEKPVEKKEYTRDYQGLPFEAKFSTNSDGKFQLDFYDKNNQDTFKQFYDTTRLIIENERTTITDAPLKECLVSWYGESDAVMIDNNGNEHGRKTAYERVLADIDELKLKTDPKYCMAVMKKLLNRNRVDEYLARGMQENPEIPCGNYVGGIDIRDGKYKKIFDMSVGKQAHNSDRMKLKRAQLKEQKEMKKQNEIEEKQKRIEQLKNEIDDLSRD